MPLNILVVGGTGIFGGYAAVYLQSLGHNVTIAGRTKPKHPPRSELPFLKGDFLQAEFTTDQLAPFDAILFTAGQDFRHVPKDEPDIGAYLLRANGEAVPAFAKLARDAGVKQFIQIGTYYLKVLPDQVESNPYMLSRKLEGQRVTALASPTFSTTSINVPYLVGGINASKNPLAASLMELYRGPPSQHTAPPGGVAFLSLKSLSEVIASAVNNKDQISGKQFFVSDENLTFAQFFNYFRRIAGKEETPMVLDDNHPMIPKSARLGGSSNLFMETDPELIELLGEFSRNDIYRAVQEEVQLVDSLDA